MRFLILLSFLFAAVNCKGQNYAKSTIHYKSDPNIKDKYHELDIYTTGGHGKSVIIFVHGGAWLLGDKSTKIKAKANYFTGKNYVFVSVNYRLSSFFNKKTQYPLHTEDVADAVAWVYRNITKYGGNPDKIILLGHSSGAQMVSLLGTSPEFLPKRNLPLERIQGIISVDTEGYDVYGMGQAEVNIYRRIFGDDELTWKHASPLLQIASGKKYPPFLIVKRGKPYRHEMAEKFAEKLRQGGTEVTVITADEYSHFESNNVIGKDKDNIITPAIESFLKNHLN